MCDYQFPGQVKGINYPSVPATLALSALPTGDQEAAGSIPAKLGNIL